MRVPCVVAFALVGVTVLGPPAFALDSGLPDRPLALDDCIALARRYNPSLVIAQQDVVSAGAAVRRALASCQPSATLIATRGQTGGSSFVETPAGTVSISTGESRRDSRIALGHVLWESGRTETVRRARRSLDASRASQEAALQDLILSVSQRYYAALVAERLVEVAEATLSAARDHERLAGALIEVGDAPPVDLVPAQAEVAEAEFALLQAANDAGLAKAQLKNEIGLPAAYSLRLAPSGPGADEDPLPSLDEALRVSLEHRPETIALRESVAAGEHSLRFARSVRRVTITASAQYDRDLTGPGKGESWSTIVSAAGFLFDGGAREADVTTARAGLRSLQAQQQRLINAVGLEVESALLEVATARKSVEASEKTQASAEALLAAAEGKYWEGAGIFVEIADAHRALARARSDRVRAVYDAKIARVALRKAMGLLAPPGVPEAKP